MTRTDWFLQEIRRMRDSTMPVVARGLIYVGPEDRWEEVGSAWTTQLFVLYPQDVAKDVERTFGVIEALQRQKRKAEEKAARLLAMPPVPAMTLAEGEPPISS